MGRDFRAARVLQSVTKLLETKSILHPPPWFNAIREVPPSRSQTIVRPPQYSQKKSKMFQPVPVGYEEDGMRSEFFNDHPWELARPRIVVEDSGNDAKSYDWSRLRQRGKKVDGESVIQRQMWLAKHEKLTPEAAYEAACKELYAHRLFEDTERQIAKEEASHYGAYFGKGPNEAGMDLENKLWEQWKAWAVKEATAMQAASDAAHSAPGSEEDIERLRPKEELLVEAEADEAMEELEAAAATTTPEQQQS